MRQRNNLTRTAAQIRTAKINHLRMKVAAMEIEAGFADALKPSNIKKFFMTWLVNPVIRLPNAVVEAFKAPFKEMMTTFLKIMGPDLAIELRKVALVDFTDKFREGFIKRISEIEQGVKYQPHKQKRVITTQIIPSATYSVRQNEVFVMGYEAAEDAKQMGRPPVYDGYANKLAVESAKNAWEETSYTGTFFKNIGAVLFDFIPVIGAFTMLLEEVHIKGWLKAIPSALAFLIGDLVIPALGLKYLSKAAFAILANLPITELAIKAVKSWSGKVESETEGLSKRDALEWYESEYGIV